jgi:hypothetical protein
MLLSAEPPAHNSGGSALEAESGYEDSQANTLNQEALILRGHVANDSGKFVSGGDTSRTRTHKQRKNKHCFTARSKGSKPKKSNFDSSSHSASGSKGECSIHKQESVYVAGEAGHVDSQLLCNNTWRAPTQEERNSGAEICGRPIRVWWDGDGQWYTGVVVKHNPDPNAVDDHGTVGPTFTVQYDDGNFEENLEVLPTDSPHIICPSLSTRVTLCRLLYGSW